MFLFAYYSEHFILFHQADTQVEFEKKAFYTASMKYVLKLQEVQERKKFEFVEIVSFIAMFWSLFFIGFFFFYFVFIFLKPCFFFFFFLVPSVHPLLPLSICSTYATMYKLAKKDRIKIIHIKKFLCLSFLLLWMHLNLVQFEMTASAISRLFEIICII